jgi:hypothetical protein
MKTQQHSNWATWMMRGSRGLAIGLGAVGLVACLQRELTPLIPCTVSGVALRVNVENVDKVDLLLVIDNSGSMTEEQSKLQEQIPRLIETLASGGRNEESIPDFPPVKDLRVGVVTTDLGTGEFNNQGCEAQGDDGRLIDETGTVPGPMGSTMAPPGCNTMGYGAGESFVSFIPPDDEAALDAEAAAFAQSVGCVALVGAGGCGFEQQLESPLKAVTPSSSETLFAGGTTGNGDVNAFVREDSLLAVLLVTDEEDCSAQDYNIFKRDLGADAPYPLPNGNIEYHNIHCYIGDAPEKALHPVQRYIDGFTALRPNPALLVFAGIVGLPDGYDDADSNGRVRFEDILADPSMKYEAFKGPSDPVYRLKPSCSAGDDGDAAPPVRIVQVAQGLDAAGAAVTLKSICADDYAPALDAIITKIADALGGQCLFRPLNPDAGGLVNCDVLERLPVGKTCSELEAKGRVLLRTEGKGEELREVCRISQLSALSTGEAETTDRAGAGWFYEYDLDDTASGAGGEPTDLENRCGQGSRRISFTEGSEPDTGSQILLECLQSVQESAPEDNDVGGFCTEPGATCAQGGQYDGKPCLAPVDLICDPKTRLWQVPCANDSECAPFVCDQTTREGGADDPYVCVNPTCG